jgi:hypothetical protein
MSSSVQVESAEPHALAREEQTPSISLLFITIQLKLSPSTSNSTMKLAIVAALIASASAWTTPKHFEVPAVSLVRWKFTD